MKRREFITLIGGAAAWPLMSRAQGRTARVGALMVIAETDSESERLADAFERGLGAAGWYKGRNLELTYRWGASNPDLLSRYAEELVRAAPNILLAFGTAALAPMHKATTTIPIVFTAVSDPVAQGFVASLAHPRRNMTGFSNYEPDIGRRWLQLLKEVAPSATQTRLGAILMSENGMDRPCSCL
jgi:putative ABC transport system substrate-binding protein